MIKVKVGEKILGEASNELSVNLSKIFTEKKEYCPIKELKYTGLTRVQDNYLKDCIKLYLKK